jgi:hypothetical protein
MPSPTIDLEELLSKLEMLATGATNADGPQRDMYRRELAFECSPPNILAIVARVRGYREALNKIASWSEGPVVKGSFDEPAAASVARTALADAERSGDGSDR